MPYFKHPEHGNRHASENEASSLLASGWTRFPRSAEEKSAGSWPPVAPVVTTVGKDDEIATVRAKLDAAGVKYHHKAGLEKLKQLLPA